MGADEQASPESQQSSILRPGILVRFRKHTCEVHNPGFFPHVKLLQSAVSAQISAHSRADEISGMPGCKSPPS